MQFAPSSSFVFPGNEVYHRAHEAAPYAHARGAGAPRRRNSKCELCEDGASAWLGADARDCKGRGSYWAGTMGDAPTHRGRAAFPGYRKGRREGEEEIGGTGPAQLVCVPGRDEAPQPRQVTCSRKMQKRRTALEAESILAGTHCVRGLF